MSSYIVGIVEAQNDAHAVRECVERIVRSHSLGVGENPVSELFDFPQEAVDRVKSGRAIAFYISDFEETNVAMSLLFEQDYAEEADLNRLPPRRSARGALLGRIVEAILCECRCTYLALGLIDTENIDRVSHLSVSEMPLAVAEDVGKGTHFNTLYLYDPEKSSR